MENSSNLFDKKGNKISLPQNGERIRVTYKKETFILCGPDVVQEGNVMAFPLGQDNRTLSTPISIPANKCVVKS